MDNTNNFIATVSSGGSATVTGTLSVVSSDTTKVTVSPASSNITANTSGVATTETITGIAEGDSTITVSFTPADTSNFNSAVNKIYPVVVTVPTLAEKIIMDDYGDDNYNAAVTAINNKSARDFKTTATTDEGLHAIADYSSISSTTLDGTSYYFRGAADDNWVSFAGYLWRVVRINGDGSVRMIYSGTTSNHTGTDTWIGTSSYNVDGLDSKFVGYTYDTDTASTVKREIDAWYENNLKEEYESYLADEIFCNDKSISLERSGEYDTIYMANERLSNSYAPTLQCVNQSDRYTLKAQFGESSISGVSGAGNNMLRYPIGLLTADEVSLAGGLYGMYNNDYYLYTSDDSFWLGSPWQYSPNETYIYSFMFSVGYYFEYSSVSYHGDYNDLTTRGIRPVINLKPSVEYYSGSGTENDPYIIKEIPTPTITLSATENAILLGGTTSFVATVNSGTVSSIPGTLTVRSLDTSVATVSPASSSVTATTSGVSTSITVNGVGGGISRILLEFTPTDTATYGVSSKIYTISVNPCLSGDTLANCLIYADYGTRNYSTATTTINNKTAIVFRDPATTDEGLHAIADYSSVSSTTLDGTSYYYRGAVEDNWVSFAGYLWRVVRINGDGSVRLIYSGTTSNHTGVDTQIGTSPYNVDGLDSKFVGYMYDTTVNSTIKGVIDTWYENNLKAEYEGYLSNEIFCNDRSIAGYDYTNNFSYNTEHRLIQYDYYNHIYPTLQCENQSDRYTLKVQSEYSGIAGVSGAGNNLLDYPIGLLTADEATLSGVSIVGHNYHGYLSTGQLYWTSSPSYGSSYSHVLFVSTFGLGNKEPLSNNYGVRPVINLKSGVKYASGNGTETNPYVIELEPTISLSEYKGSVAPSDTLTFTATVYSGDTSSIPGTFTVSSSDTSKATVSPATSSITAIPSGTSVTVTVTGVASGSSTITVGFTPTDTTTYSTPESRVYTVTTRNDYTVTFNGNGGTFANNANTNTLVYPLGYLTLSNDTVTKYSHTSNVDDTGLKTSNYGNNWTNANITGTDRGDTTKAHVVTIPGARSLTVEIYYNGQGTSYDWVTVWAGSHPDYTAGSNYTSGISGGTRLGGSQSGSYTVNGNSLTNMGHSTFTIHGDTVTFGFKSNASNVGQGYGYYAIITNNGPIESVTYTGTYEEPTKSGYDFVGWLSSADGNVYNNLSGESLRPDDDITYTAQWGHYVAIPTNSYCRSGLSYTGSSQILTNAPGTGYSFSGNSAIDSGYHIVTAILDTDYVWEDNTRDNKGIRCNIYKIYPVLTLGATSGSVVEGNTSTFTAIVTSDVASAGTLSVVSDSTDVVTVSPTSSSITATTAGTSVTETITGVSRKGQGTITVDFIPTDIVNFSRPQKMYYSAFVEGVNQCLSGDTLADCLVYNDYGGRNYSNAIANINNKAPSDFTSISTTYEGLKAIEDYSSVSGTTLDGTSYYYRGDIRDNWVSFGGFLWRVVRINGDGSVRLIYSGTSSNHTGTGTRIGTSAFGSDSNDPKYVGYTYDDNEDSVIKGVVDTWYESNLMENYESYLSNEIFCNDRSVDDNSFGAFKRIFYNSAPSLVCVNQADKYTLKLSGNSYVSGINGAGNNLLNYPIGLLTADEAAIAGSGNYYGYINDTYYLYTGQTYWLGSPSYISSSYLGSTVTSSGYLDAVSVSNTSYNIGVRPVINLKSSVEYYGGSGSENNPYVIKELPTPVLTLSSAQGTVIQGNTTTFTATVASGSSSNIPGTLVVKNTDASIATVSPASTNVTATVSGVATTITLSGVNMGSSKIIVEFIPTDTTTYAVSSKIYNLTVAPCTAGDTLANCLIYSDSGTRNYSDATAAISNKTARDFNTTATTDEGLHAIADYSSVSSTTLDGTSYYYRGAVEDNWVSFAGYLWRVVRINGDGSVRMIYSGTTSNHAGTGTQIGTSSFDDSIYDQKHINYVHDTDTVIKENIDTWYENNLKDNYESYLSNEIFCNDTSIGSIVTADSYYYFGAYSRLYENKAPSLVCTNQSDRYTLKNIGISSIQGVSGDGNNRLNYPIGLLTADEVSLAGGKYNTSNNNYYLYSGQYYWLSSPHNVRYDSQSNTANMFYTSTYGSISYYELRASGIGIRPVVNLKPSIKYVSGTGTVSDPYEIESINTSTMMLSATEGSVMTGNTTSFVATVTSGSTSNISGTLLVRSEDTSKATVSPASSNITATPSGVSTTITATAAEAGVSKITVFFIPTDTTYGVSSKTYTLTVVPCTSGDTLANCLVYADTGTRNYSNAVTAINNKSARDFSTTATTDEGLHAAADYSSISSTTLDGTSYYYRGSVQDNWVSFAGYYWRVVRINGDGSIRLIYSGTSSDHGGSYTSISDASFSSASEIYYMSGSADSSIKKGLDRWYKNNINTIYENYLSNQMFCFDKEIDSISGYYTYYGAYSRLVTNKTPSLGCPNKEDMYTLREIGPSIVLGSNGAGNNKLDYPIGLLTADEAALAGGVYDVVNNSFYLYAENRDYWLGSPFYKNSNVTTGFEFYMKDSSSGTGDAGKLFATQSSVSHIGFRPVINLKASVKYNGGIGTESDPYVVKQEPALLLSSSIGGVYPNDTTTFTAKVYSGGESDISGLLTVSSSDTSKATVTPASSNVTAIPGGTEVTITITGVALGSSTITVTFTPTDTNYDAVSKIYTVTTRNNYTIDFDANGGTFTNSNTTNTIVYPTDYLTISQSNVTKYSHTSNVDDTGLRTSNFGNNWTNANITGTDRGDTSKAHVVTISGASFLTVDIYYSGDDGDWATIWAGSHPDYTAANNYTSSIIGGAQLGGYQGGSYTVNGNSLTSMGYSQFIISGDTVTFGFKSDSSGGWYGYYAVITGTFESITYTGTYEEPTKAGYEFLGWLSSEDGNIYHDISGESLRPDEDVTYTAQWGHYIAIPTATNYCKSGLAYTGSSQILTNTPATGYTFSGNTGINAGSYEVTASLDTDYVWIDDSRGTKTFSCSIGKVTPTISLSSTSGGVEVGSTSTFTATVTSSVNSAGTLTVTSRASSVATVSPASSSLTATTTGVSTTETITGIAKGYSTITVSFTPTDTTNFNSPSNKTYSLSVNGVNQCISGDTLANCLVYNDYGGRNYSDAVTAIGNKSASNFSSVSETYEGLKSISDYSSISATTLDGTSYYYRGRIGDNWVSFAGFLWRVVRINGDGSVRMIYSGTTSNHAGTGTRISTSAFNSSRNNSKYVGYMYDTTTNSTMKGVIDTWYENNLKASYEGYLSNEIFCNDTSVGSTSGSTIYYSTYARLYTNKTPTLECVNQSDRYTLKESGLSSISGVNGAGNNMLDYPVGLLTADEVAIAGGVNGTNNTSYYLYTGQNYRLGSPYRYYSSSAYAYYVNTSGNLTNAYVTTSYGVRPVINLKSGVKYASGDGTEGNPYVIQEIPTPAITLSANSGSVDSGDTTTFTATVTSSNSYNIAGTLTVSSGDTSKATVSPASTNVTATQAGVATTITVTGVAEGSSSITVSFTPTDTVYYNSASDVLYTATVSSPPLAKKLIMDDYGSNNYAAAVAAINNKSAVDFSTTATTDEGLHAIADYSSVSATTLDGTSYYYRGAVEDNWVDFAGYLWRIVRINGDGSIRLIYSGTTSIHTGSGTQIGTSVFNSNGSDSKYVGYTYDDNGTETDSIIKTAIDNWYIANIKPNYEGYLSNEIFCNDRTYTVNGNIRYFGAYTRLTANKTPTLLCTNTQDKYTLKVSGQSSISGTNGAGNNLLEYPVGLLTADEVSLAGGVNDIENSSSYLYTSSSYWLGSPRIFNGAAADLFTNWDGKIAGGGNLSYNKGVRPVLNLKPSVKWNGGDGSENTPYTVKL
ncbi:InlB B-repeat-containing protein [bacterium]|nr:InlB B-repeat-containing protein [bacterium]